MNHHTFFFFSANILYLPTVIWNAVLTFVRFSKKKMHAYDGQDIRVLYPSLGQSADLDVAHVKEPLQVSKFQQ
jgi:hypothetical protein